MLANEAMFEPFGLTDDVARARRHVQSARPPLSVAKAARESSRLPSGALELAIEASAAPRLLSLIHI